MTSYTNVFGGGSILPTDDSYRAFTIAADTALSWPATNQSSSNTATALMDITASSGSLSILMPDATLVSPGRAVLIFNAGANTFTVKDSGGSSLCSIASGQAWWVSLRSNATAAGTWRTVQFGATTSTANAADLAGPGLASIGTQLEQIVTVQTINSSPYTISTASLSRAVVWTGAGGTFTLDLAATLGASWFCHVKNAGSGTLTVARSGSDTIDGAASISLGPTESCIIVTDGTTFYTVGKGQTATSTFTFLSINVAGSGTYTLSAAEYAKTALSFTGLLTGNRIIEVPATVQQYYVANNTTGAYTLTVQVVGAPGATVAVPQAQTMIVYSDGTNVIKANSAGIATPIAVADGGTGAITASAARTNLGATATGDAVFTAASQAAARTAIGAAASSAASIASGLTVTSGGAAITGNSSVTGTFGVSSTLTVTAGGLTVSGGGANITGAITTANWNGNVIAGQYGGTGVNNSGKTITLGGNFTTSGAFAATLTLTNTTNVTLPTTGTLATLAGSETLTNKTLTSPTINAGALSGTFSGAHTLSGLVTMSAGATITGAGLQVGAPTGGDKGAGTINAQAIYVNNVAVSTASGPTLGTETATTSGQSKDFTGIPSGTKRIIVILKQVSATPTFGGATDFGIQLGDSGGIETDVTFNLTGGASGFASSWCGHVILTRINSGGTTWVATWITQDGSNTPKLGSGTKTLSAELDRVRFMMLSGSDTFDAGSINILYD